MKKLCLLPLLVLTCIYTTLSAQTNSLVPVDLKPRAGQVLPANQEPILPGEILDREIDFDSLNMSFTGNWPAGQSFSISASPTGDTLFVGEGGLLDVLPILKMPVLYLTVRRIFPGPIQYHGHAIEVDNDA